VTQAKSTCLTLLALTFTSALGCERDPSTAPPDLVVTSDLEKFKAPVCNLDGVDCYCVPGGTLAAAHWTFRGIVPTKFPEGLYCTLDCRVARVPYGDLTAETSFSGTVAVWNPSTKLKSAPFPFTLRSQVSASTEFRIPARVKVVGSDGSLTEVGLFEKLVDKGEVHLEVQCAQLDTMLAFTANDLRVSPSKVERDEREKTAVSPKPDLQGMETDSYGRAMTACRLAWRRCRGQFPLAGRGTGVAVAGAGGVRRRIAARSDRVPPRKTALGSLGDRPRVPTTARRPPT
jgi:hypothetical protein